MKFIPNVHDYFMVQTFNIRGNLVKEGSFDNNNIESGRNLGLDFEIHFKPIYNSMEEALKLQRKVHTIDISENSINNFILQKLDKGLSYEQGTY